MKELSIENLELVGGAAWPAVVAAIGHAVRTAAPGAATGVAGYGAGQYAQGNPMTVPGIAGAAVAGAIPSGSVYQAIGGGIAGGMTERLLSDDNASGTSYHSGAAGTGYN